MHFEQQCKVSVVPADCAAVSMNSQDLSNSTWGLGESAVTAQPWQVLEDQMQACTGNMMHRSSPALEGILVSFNCMSYILYLSTGRTCYVFEGCCE